MKDFRETSQKVMIKSKNKNIKLLNTKFNSFIVLGMILAFITLTISGCSSKSTSIDISEYVGQPISVAVEEFGEYRDSYNNIGSPICVFSDGLVMTNANNSISSLQVDFSKVSDKTKYSYKGIDGNSTKEDVVKILGNLKICVLLQIHIKDIQ